MFYDQIRQLVTDHPPDKLEENGAPFWAPPRRYPTLQHPEHVTAAECAVCFAASYSLSEFIWLCVYIRA